MHDKKRTEIAELGEFGLIDCLTRSAAADNESTLKGVGDDAAVIAAGRNDAIVVSTDALSTLRISRSNIWVTRL